MPFEPATFITENIFLGPQNAAKELSYLKENKIGTIVLAGESLKSRFPNDIDYIYLEIADDPNQEITSHFENISNQIKAAKEKENPNILIHCVSGISRSATLVIAYLMKE